MIMNQFDHLDSDVLLKRLLKAFSRNVELREQISKNIRQTSGGERLSWIKKFNSLFVVKWITK